MKNQKPMAVHAVAAYIMPYFPGVQKKLKGLRKAIKAAAPDAEERISCHRPAFWLKGK